MKKINHIQYILLFKGFKNIILQQHFTRLSLIAIFVCLFTQTAVPHLNGRGQCPSSSLGCSTSSWGGRTLTSSPCSRCSDIVTFGPSLKKKDNNNYHYFQNKIFCF